MSHLNLSWDLDSQVKSELSCLNRDGWTLCKGFRKKMRNLSSSNCWRCIKIVSPTITTFCIILNLLPSCKQTFLVPGAPPPLPHAYGPEYCKALTQQARTARRKHLLRQYHFGPACCLCTSEF